MKIFSSDRGRIGRGNKQVKFTTSVKLGSKYQSTPDQRRRGKVILRPDLVDFYTKRYNLSK